VSWEILAASLLANLMSLASSVYVILVLNRYVGYGFDGTLYTLTIGVLIASALGFAFGEVRTRLAGVVSQGPDEELEERSLAVVTRARLSDLNRFPPTRHLELLGAMGQVRSAFDAAIVSAVLDAPFMLVFLIAIALISPWLMFITVFAVCLSALFSVLGLRRAEADGLKLQRETHVHRAQLSRALSGAATVRAFSGGEFLRNVWRSKRESLAPCARSWRADQRKSRLRQESVAVFLRVFVYAFGAMLGLPER
jgi:ATP-binding cassette subfamily C protein LapB